SPEYNKPILEMDSHHITVRNYFMARKGPEASKAFINEVADAFTKDGDTETASDYRALLEGELAYYTGDETAFAGSLMKLPDSSSVTGAMANLCLGKPADAIASLDKEPDQRMWRVVA